LTDAQVKPAVDSLERSVSWDRGRASGAFATGLGMFGAGIVSGMPSAVVGTAKVAVAPEVASSLTFLPGLAECVLEADSAA
jgi:hypothetical protein